MIAATLPLHRQLNHSSGVFVFDVAVFHAVFVDEAGDFDVVGAVFGNFPKRFELAGFFVFLPPADGVEAVGGFSGAEAGRSDVVEFEEAAHALFDIEHHVEVDGLFFQIGENVGLEHGIIETDVVPTHHEIGFEQKIGEGIEFVFPIDHIFISGSGVGDRDGNAKFGFIRETTHIADTALGF